MLQRVKLYSANRSAPPLGMPLWGSNSTHVTAMQLTSSVLSTKAAQAAFGLCLVCARSRATYPIGDEEEVPVPREGERLELRRRTLGGHDERFLGSSEPVLQLLFDEAVSMVEEGRLEATEAQLDMLDEYADPSFPARLQYVSLAQELRGWGCIPMPAARLAAEAPGVGLPWSGAVRWALWVEGVRLAPVRAGGAEGEGGGVLVRWETIRCWLSPKLPPLAVGEWGFEVAVEVRLPPPARPVADAEPPFPQSGGFEWVRLVTPGAAGCARLCSRVIGRVMRDRSGPEFPEPKGACGSARTTANDAFTAL